MTRTLAEGRFAHACVLAARDRTPRPVRHEPCFFDPSHGPAHRDLSWAPPGGTPREIPVCFRDFERLSAGEPPSPRLVRLGDRRVPWFMSGPAYSAWAAGWYYAAVRAGRLETDRLTMTYGGSAVGGVVIWADPGAWGGGGSVAGHGGGWDPGGGDFGTGGGFDVGGGGDGS